MKGRITLFFTIFLLYTGFYAAGIGCPIRFMTGIPCPGCGMTRAWQEVSRMHVHEAFHYHPLFFLAPTIILLFLFEKQIPAKIRRTSWSIIIISMVSVYLYRLVFIDSTVIYVDLENSFMIVLLKKILSGGHT